MRYKLSGRVALGVATGISTLGLAVTGAATAGAHAVAHKAKPSSAAPSFTPVAPAKKLGGVVLNVGDQAGTGAQAVLEAAGLYHGSVSGGSGVLKDGLHVTFNDFTAGPPIMQAEEAGADDIGGVGDAPPVFADPTGKLVIVGMLKSSYDSAALLVPANSGITSISQLKGKTIAVGVGTSADYHFYTIAKSAGLTEKDFTIDNATGANGLAALKSGDVAAFDTWSPYLEDAEDQGFKALYSGPPYGSPYSYEVASEAALKNPKKVLAIRDYLTELDAGYVWVNKHPQYWAHAWANVTGLPLTVMRAATLDDPYEPVAVGANAVTQEQNLINAFASAGEIPSAYKVAPYVTSAFSDSVTGKWTTTTTKKKKTKKK